MRAVLHLRAITASGMEVRIALLRIGMLHRAGAFVACVLGTLSRIALHIVHLRLSTRPKLLPMLIGCCCPRRYKPRATRRKRRRRNAARSQFAKKRTKTSRPPSLFVQLP